VIVRDATLDDAEAITAIYNHVIGESDAIWIDHEVTLDDRRAWLQGQLEAGRPTLVAVGGDEEGDEDGDVGQVLGYCAAFPFRDKAGYRFTAEHTILLAPGHRGHGVGQALLDALIERSVAAGLAVMVAGCDGGNHGAIAFHERNGFRQVARMPGVGRKRDRPVDLVLLQRELTEPAG
jgi:phosphinothricin acetyltransferase